MNYNDLKVQTDKLSTFIHKTTKIHVNRLIFTPTYREVDEQSESSKGRYLDGQV